LASFRITFRSSLFGNLVIDRLLFLICIEFGPMPWKWIRERKLLLSSPFFAGSHIFPFIVYPLMNNVSLIAITKDK
jgi:hypothetical protein